MTLHDLVTCPAGEEGEREHGEEDCVTCTATKDQVSAYDGRFAHVENWLAPGGVTVVA